MATPYVAPRIQDAPARGFGTVSEPGANLARRRAASAASWSPAPGRAADTVPKPPAL